MKKSCLALKLCHSRVKCLDFPMKIGNVATTTSKNSGANPLPPLINVAASQNTCSFLVASQNT